MQNPNLRFNEIHTQKKRMKLQAMMHQVACETLEKFPLSTRSTKCPCCLSKKIEFYVNKFGYNLDKCNDCDHIFTNPMPSPEALDYYYNSPFKNFENEFFLASFEARIPIFLQRLNLLCDFTDGKNILDIGTAVGILIEANKRYEKNFNIDACDLNKASCDLLRQKYPDVKVFNENVINLPNANYEIVTLWDTFEHIPNVSELLFSIKNQLIDEGLFVFSTPNTASLEWKVMAKEHVQLLPPGHVNLYNTKNIRDLLIRHGFETLSVSTLNPSLDLDYIKNIFESDGHVNGKKRRFISEIYSLLDDECVFEVITSKLRERKFAGNMVIIAKKMSFLSRNRT